MMDGELAKSSADGGLWSWSASGAHREIQKRQLDPEKLRKLRLRNIDGPKHPTELEKRMKDKRLRWRAGLGLMVVSFLVAATLGHFDRRNFWPTVSTIFIPTFTIWGFWALKG